MTICSMSTMAVEEISVVKNFFHSHCAHGTYSHRLFGGTDFTPAVARIEEINLARVAVSGVYRFRGISVGHSHVYTKFSLFESYCGDFAAKVAAADCYFSGGLAAERKINEEFLGLDDSRHTRCVYYIVS